jgi:hypothetical protein
MDACKRYVKRLSDILSLFRSAFIGKILSLCKPNLCLHTLWETTVWKAKCLFNLQGRRLQLPVQNGSESMS